MMRPALFDGQWETGPGPVFRSVNPAIGETVWEGQAASAAQVDRAVAAARSAFAGWAQRPIEQRIEFLNRFAEELKSHRQELAEAISREVGKPLWESLTEADAMINKVPVSIQAFTERRREIQTTVAGVVAATRFKPHGVVAVLGPFNFPGHLPNGHIVPALLAGNAVVFKPSELTPLVAEETIRIWNRAGLPAGVLNLVQGGRNVGEALVSHAQVDGIFFTGSAAVGKAIRRSLADQPGKILALEMGGNNPLIVWETADVPAAIYHTIQSAYLTAGQRCTCARRLIVPQDAAGDAFIRSLTHAVENIQVGIYTSNPEPFMGPVINNAAAEKLLAGQKQLLADGAKPLAEMRSANEIPAMLRPGLIDVTEVQNRPDEEMFGPLLQVIRVNDFDAALLEANHTTYGLAAGLISDSRSLYETFFNCIRAGVVNWNRPTTGASGGLPFGGIGTSGNHRPSGYFAADYCSYPIASIEGEKSQLPAKLLPGVTLTSTSP